jgi:hypothetical protein
MAKNKKNGNTDVVTPILPKPVNPLNIPSVYANNMEIGATGMDVRLTFNEVIAGQSGITF